jgi:hypothetical protein
MKQDAMHLRQFMSVDPVNLIRLREFNGGLFYLEDLSEMEATFTIQGYVTHVLMCPGNEKFGYVFG